MCGRYQIFIEEDALAEMVQQAERGIQKRFGSSGVYRVHTGEIFPTNLAPILKPTGNALTPEAAQWGYPHWKNKKQVLFNTRMETAETSHFWQDSLHKRRCLVPASGFYEWQHGGPKDGARLFFTLPRAPVMYMAGIYKPYTDEQSQPLDRYSIMTTAPNACVEAVHNRMPVVLEPEELDTWLYGDYLSLMNRERVTLSVEWRHNASKRF